MGLFFDEGVSSENNPMEETLCGWHIAWRIRGLGNREGFPGPLSSTSPEDLVFLDALAKRHRVVRPRYVAILPTTLPPTVASPTLPHQEERAPAATAGPDADDVGPAFRLALLTDVLGVGRDLRRRGLATLDREPAAQEGVLDNLLDGAFVATR